MVFTLMELCKPKEWSWNLPRGTNQNQDPGMRHHKRTSLDSFWEFMLVRTGALSFYASATAGWTPMD